MKNSLKKELIIYISFLLIAALFLMNIMVIKMMENILTEQKIKDARLLISLLQTNFSLFFKERQFAPLLSPPGKKPPETGNEEINKLISQFIRDDAFYHLLIVNKDNLVIASNNPKEIGASFENERLKQTILSGTTLIEEGRSFFSLNRGDTLKINTPFYLDNKIAGGIRGEMSLFQTRREILRARWLTIVFILIDAAIFIIFAVILIIQKLIKPLQKLVKATEEITRGNLNQQVAVEEENEIGKLSSSFNLMVKRLRQKTESLKEHIELLEKTNLELQEAKSEVIRSERLASVGRLAAGVAHEIGNPLGAIEGYLNILIKSSEQTKEGINILERIEKEVERIDKIVRDLLNLASPPQNKEMLEKVNVNELINDSLELLASQNAFKGIIIHRDLAVNLPLLRMDRHKLRQVFINLLLNARDALLDKGDIFISSKTIIYPSTPDLNFSPQRKTDPNNLYFQRHPRKQLFSPFRKGDKLIRLIFSDTGSGIEGKNLERIFDPFFTTKELGKGTGLGLSICHRIIEDLGGEIKVFSAPEKGTSFEILLPLKRVKRKLNQA